MGRARSANVGAVTGAVTGAVSLNNASYCPRSTGATVTWAMTHVGVACPHNARMACTLNGACASSNCCSAASTRDSPSCDARCKSCT
jgi:hypothetical protein